MFVPFDKPPLLFADQVTNLRVKGLVVQNVVEAEKMLSKINYYRLRGYYIHLYDKRTDKFLPGTSLQDVLNIYNFDDELRTITGKHLISIEVAMRCIVAYRLAHEYGGLGYTCVNNFYKKAEYYDFYHTAVNEIGKSRDLHIEHFQDNYGGRIPIWSLVEIISMTCLSKLLGNLLPVDLKYITSSIYNLPTDKMLKANFYALSMVRNMCAHGNRLFNRLVTIKPAINTSDVQHLPYGQLDSFFAILFAMKYLSLDVPTWNQYLDKIESLLSKHSANVELKHLGFSPNWKMHLIK